MDKVPSVSEVIFNIKRLLEGEFRTVSVEGEISNLSHSSSGHWYLTLSDSDSSLSAAVFKMDALRNPLMKSLKNGDKVICSGSIGVYNKRGTFQLIVKRISPVGKGDLKEQFEMLKRKLAAEGLFDPQIKKEIPTLPNRIAVITAKGAAALQDFLNIIDRRTQWYDILLSPALVQGDAAPASLRKALFNVIKYSMDAPEDKKIDVIVFTRGGGSMEDLWAFNDEGLAWDIFNCPIPIISAVGHQVDTTICDMVSDLRCETPSAAAEVLSNAQAEIKETLDWSGRHLARSMTHILGRSSERLQMGHPKRVLDVIWRRVNEQQKKLGRIDLINRANDYLGIYNYNQRLDDSIYRLKTGIEKKYSRLEERNRSAYDLLRVLDPTNVLGRGYSIVKDDNDKVVPSMKVFEKLKSGQKISLMFHDGVGIARAGESS
ncbi:MAG: exodeoxyribonuclease VII large subunit [Deltaproteobacteria bacterium]|nr:MAG: exodeoxyribonuclease VII large subunit [Deltaproteobacteria bacterium]TNF25678.1 MAG: exodeoxyribonuclease VII large subunit [Deltaproteobacteria bacterium]